ncbi:hypothetical protein LXL04_025145 [Taraxacum kok-saghyz]
MELGLSIFILTIPLLLTIAQSILFEIQSGQTRCIYDEFKINSMIVAEYSVVNPNKGHPLPEYHKIDVMLFSEKENRYHNVKSVESGHFALQVVEEGKHMLCFLTIDHEPMVNTTVELNWRSAVTTKGWHNVAKKDSVDTMELELKKMEETVTLIHDEMFYLRKREEEMKELTKYTNSVMDRLELAQHSTMELGIAVFILTLPFLSTIAHSIRFEVESGHVKCIGEDIRINSMTVGHYSIVNPNEGHPLPEHHKMTVRLYSATGNRLHFAEVVESGEFAFHVTEDGDHMACFSAIEHQPAVNISVDFNWRSGVTAKGWSNVAKKGSVDAMQLELRKMEDMVASINEQMMYLRKRGQIMQGLNRKTNSQLGLFSLVSLFLCLSVAGLQRWHLKTFFEKKKII